MRLHPHHRALQWRSACNNLRQVWTNMQTQRCFWTPGLGLCSLASVGVRRSIPVNVSSSSICSFMQLAPFRRSLALWHRGQFIWQGTWNGYVWAMSAAGVGRASGPCKQKIQKEKNPYTSAWHGSSLRLSELLFTLSPAQEEMREWLVFLLSLECTSTRGP